MEESNNPLIVAIASVLLSIAAWAKNKLDVDGVKKDRAETKEKRDTDNALLNAKLEMMQKQFDDYKETTEKRLDAGDLLMKGFTEQFSLLNSNVAYIWEALSGNHDAASVPVDNANNAINALYATSYASGGPLDTALAGKASATHTHPLSIEPSALTTYYTLAGNTVYKLTAGGNDLIIKTPPSTFFAIYDLTPYGDFTAAFLAGCDIYVCYPTSAGDTHYNFVNKPQINVQEYHGMYTFIMAFDIVNTSTGQVGTIMWKLNYEDGWCHWRNGAWESGTANMYSAVDYYAPNLATKTDLNSYATIASLSDYATKTEMAAVSRYGCQHASVLIRSSGNYDNNISGTIYDARGVVVETFSSANTIPGIINKTADIVELFLKVTNSSSSMANVGFNFTDVAKEKKIRIHVRNSSSQVFRIRLRKESTETTNCTFYTESSAEVGTYYLMNTPANATSEWTVMRSGLESNTVWCIKTL